MEEIVEGAYLIEIRGEDPIWGGGVTFRSYEQDVYLSTDYSPSREIAIEKARRLIAQLESGGFYRSAEDVEREDYEKWPTLMPRRSRWLEHYFGTIGTGCAWIGGGVYPKGTWDMSRTPEERVPTVPTEMGIRIEKRKKKFLAENAPLPLPEEGGPLNLYPLSERFSPIFRVPDNVQDGWLQAAIDAATLYATRALSGQDRKKARDILSDLTSRFSDRNVTFPSLTSEDDFKDWPKPERKL